MKKKLISLLLAVTLCLSLGIVVFADESIAEGGFPDEHSHLYTAEILHAEEVNKYGSDISNKASIEHNVPITIEQNGGEINLLTTLKGSKISINGEIKGHGESGEILYFESSCDSGVLEVLSMMYVDEYSPCIIFSEDNSLDNGNNVLQIILKDLTELREYFIIEIFDFNYENFTEAINSYDTCEPNYWYASEFEPIKQTTGQINTLSVESYVVEIKKIFHMNMLEIHAYMYLEKSDDITNIAKNSTTDWISKIKIVGKKTEVPDAPEMNSSTHSALYITNAEYSVRAPQNCAFTMSVVDGIANGRPDNPSLSISVGWGPISVSTDVAFSPTKIDINKNTYIYDNANLESSAKRIKVSISDYELFDVGDYLSILNSVKDYGGISTPNNEVYSQWYITTQTHVVASSEHNIRDMHTVRVL